jgi:hypothetical protein
MKVTELRHFSSNAHIKSRSSAGVYGYNMAMWKVQTGLVVMIEMAEYYNVYY